MHTTATSGYHTVLPTLSSANVENVVPLHTPTLRKRTSRESSS